MISNPVAEKVVVNTDQTDVIFNTFVFQRSEVGKIIFCSYMLSYVPQCLLPNVLQCNLLGRVFGVVFGRTYPSYQHPVDNVCDSINLDERCALPSISIVWKTRGVLLYRRYFITARLF